MVVVSERGLMNSAIKNRCIFVIDDDDICTCDVFICWRDWFIIAGECVLLDERTADVCVLYKHYCIYIVIGRWGVIILSECRIGAFIINISGYRTMCDPVIHSNRKQRHTFVVPVSLVANCRKLLSFRCVRCASSRKRWQVSSWSRQPAHTIAGKQSLGETWNGRKWTHFSIYSL